jgi:hypothetical protein
MRFYHASLERTFEVIIVMHFTTAMDSFGFTTVYLIDIDESNFVVLMAFARDVLHDR